MEWHCNIVTCTFKGGSYPHDYPDISNSPHSEAPNPYNIWTHVLRGTSHWKAHSHRAFLFSDCNCDSSYRCVAVVVCQILLPRECSVIKCCWLELSSQQGTSCWEFSSNQINSTCWLESSQQQVAYCQESSSQQNFITKHFLGNNFFGQ